MHPGLPEAPAVRALAVHPLHPKIIYAGTQSGPVSQRRSRRALGEGGIADHGLPVWSIMFHPHDPDTMFVGYENCEIHRSDDAGERWIRLPVSVRFPEITTAPGANPAKRVLQMDASVNQPDHLYAAIEVGGTIRSTDGGEHWENLSHGQYLNDDAVDMHGVLVSRWRPGTVFGIGRAGMFHSADGGDHWRHVELDADECQGPDLLPRHPRGAGQSAQAVRRGRQPISRASRRTAVQRRRRRYLDAGRYGHAAAAHDVRAGVRRTPACTDVVRHQRRRGLQQPRRRRDMGGAQATAGRHADLCPCPRLRGAWNFGASARTSERLQQRCLELAADFATRSSSHDRDASHPIENYDRLRPEGFLELTDRKKWGGAGASFLDHTIAYEALGQGCPSTALSFNMHASVVMPVLQSDEVADAAKEQVADLVVRQQRLIGGNFSEPGTTSLIGERPLSARARAVDGGYSVTGRKMFASMLEAADHVMVMAYPDVQPALTPACCCWCRLALPDGGSMPTGTRSACGRPAATP